MSKQLKITIAQLNPILGNIDYNCSLMLGCLQQAKLDDSDLIVFPELSITGYPTEDLVFKPAFQHAVLNAVHELAETAADGPALLVGFPYEENGNLYNAMGLLQDGKLSDIRLKHTLPSYGVFDEKRLFEAGPLQGILDFKGVKIGLPICEDIWHEKVCGHLCKQGAEILISPNCSPYTKNRIFDRHETVLKRVEETNIPVVYINQMGGQDELVFDGASFVINADQTLAAQFPAFINMVSTICFNRNQMGKWHVEQSEIAEIELDLQGLYHACVLGLRDYVSKNRFPSVVLGLSGGVDSAICAAIAVDALGADKVHCVMMPYEYTSEESLADAKKCAKNLGVKYDILPISAPVDGFNAALEGMFKGTQNDITEENLQSRARGAMLMAISNKFGSMVLTTGNKSEVSVGYSTLYGDMCGGFNPIKDIYKTDIFEMCKMRNQYRPKDCLGKVGEIIPENIISKPPTAELRPNQLDQDSLPPYDILDDILYSLVELDLSQQMVIERGAKNGFKHSLELVKKINNLLFIAEYKRRQAAPGVRVSQKGFGTDRRYPITNGFRE